MKPSPNGIELALMNDMCIKALVRAWDRDYNPRGQQFVAWNAGTFTIPADDPLAIELWDRRELGHRLTVESTNEMAWWIDRMDRTREGTLIVTCCPYADVLRDYIVPDWKLIGAWLAAEEQWKSQQKITNNLRTKIAKLLADMYEHKCCDECDQTRIESAYKEYLDDADAVIGMLGLVECDVEDCRCRHSYVTGWNGDNHD